MVCSAGAYSETPTGEELGIVDVYRLKCQPARHLEKDREGMGLQAHSIQLASQAAALARH